MRKMILIPEEQYYKMLETYDQVIEEVVSLREQLEVLKLSEIQQVKIEILMKSKDQNWKNQREILEISMFFQHVRTFFKKRERG